MNASAESSILVARGLQKTFGRGPLCAHVLRGLDLTVRRGEFLAVMGPSGCGKSTLLHVLGLMTPPDDGLLTIDGLEVSPSEGQRTALRKTHIGFVFQRFNLLPVLSAMDNIRISLRVRGLALAGQAEELLKAMGAWHVAGRRPGQMSIGEQQRVAVARALAHRPAILLADEPTGNLDSANAEALLGLFREINRRDGQTIVMITHAESAAQSADRVVHMRDGRILDV